MPPRLTTEPAVLLISTLAPFLQTLLLALTNLSPEVQAAWNALTVTVAGAVTAWVVARERLLPALLGAAQAVIALLAVHGFGLSAEQATGLSATLAVLVGQFVRTQVTAIEPLRRPDISAAEPTVAIEPLRTLSSDVPPVHVPPLNTSVTSSSPVTWATAPEPAPEPAERTTVIPSVEPTPEPAPAPAPEPESSGPVTVDELLRKYRPQPIGWPER